MEEKDIFHYWKQYKHYWELVVGNSFSAAWVRVGGIFTIIVPTLIGVWLSLKTKPFESLAEFVARPDMMPFLAFLAIAILFALFLVSIVPVRLAEKQDNEINALKLENQRLLETLQPKLELIYDHSSQISHQHWGNNLYDFRIMIKNTGVELLNNLQIKIKETHPPAFEYFPFELGITHNESNVLNPSEFRFVDVLETHPEHDYLFFCAKQTSLQQRCPIQDYEILISASGDKTVAVEKWFRFSVNPPNSTYAYRFEELNPTA